MTSWFTVAAAFLLACTMLVLTVKMGPNKAPLQRTFLVTGSVVTICLALLLFVNHYTGTVGTFDDFGAFFALFGWGEG